MARVYGGRSAAERRQERRERLLAAGLELIGGAGYGTATIELVCARAGVTARHFYEEYPSREDLLLAVFESCVEGSLHAVRAALADAPDDPVVRSQRALGALVRHLLGDPRLARVQCLEVVGVSPRVETARRAALRRFAALLTAEAAHFGLARHADAVGLGALALVAGANELIVEALVGPDPPTPDQVTDELVRLFRAVTIAGAGGAAGVAGAVPGS